MLPILSSAATGMTAQQQQMEIIAHNMANVNTPSFKAIRGVPRELAFPSGAAGETAGGGGVEVAMQQRLMSRGPLYETGQPLDLAIAGEGFFAVEMTDGSVAYTRDGSFHRDAQGNLVTAGGLKVRPPISVATPGRYISIDRKGTIAVATEPDGKLQPLGQLQLATFANPGGLESLGGNLYRETTLSGAATLGAPDNEGRGYIIAGALEAANVDMADQMGRLLEALRAYQLNVRMVQTWDEMLSLANQLAGP